MPMILPKLGQSDIQESLATSFPNLADLKPNNILKVSNLEIRGDSPTGY